MEKEINKEELSEDMFVGYNEQGEQKVFYKLLEFDSKETGKHYLAYTDNETDDEGNLKAYGSIVTEEDDHMKLEPIATEKEWKVIEMALKVLQEEVQDNENEEA